MLNTARAPEFLQLLEDRLPPKTFRHVVSVAEYMVTIAEAAGITREQAETAGLMHDYCKAMKGDALLVQAEAYDLEISTLHRERPTLLHGPVAAEECRRDLDVDVDGVYEAIRWHTTGTLGLGPVGIALYVADFSEPFRTMPQAEEARSIVSERGFEAGVRFVVAEKVAHVERKHTLDPATAAFQQWIEGTWKP